MLILLMKGDNMDKNEIKKIDDLYNLLRIKPKALEDYFTEMENITILILIKIQ